MRLRKQRHLLRLLRPYRAKVALMLLALTLATAAALAPPYLAGKAIDDGIRGEDMSQLHARRGAVRGGRAGQLGSHLRADLHDQLDRPARPAGPASPALRAPPEPVDRLLLAQQDGRADLAHHQRRAGARPARDRGDRHALLRHAHAVRHGGHPARARPRAGADHLHHLPPPARGQRGVPARLARRLPAHAGEDSHGHRLPAGDAVGRAGGARLRAGAAPRAALRRAQRRAPRGQPARRSTSTRRTSPRSSCSRRWPPRRS